MPERTWDHLTDAERIAELAHAVRVLDDRVKSLREIVLGFERLFTVTRTALEGHQMSIEALAEMAGVKVQPKPLPPGLIQ